MSLRHVPNFMLSVVVALVGVTAIAVVAAWRATATWVPLGPYPVQDILDDDLTISVWDFGVEVEGTKCRFGDGYGVQVTGSLSWRRVDPPGLVAGRLEFDAATHSEGCITSKFVNPIPQDVLEDVCGNGPSVWAITGRETPTGVVLEDNTVRARKGLTLGWETEAFTLTCEDSQ